MEDQVHTFFLSLMAILLAARIMAEVALRLRIPPVVGELFAGILLGPSLLGWLEPQPVLKLLAEIGIILLLFEVGMVTDASRLVRAGPNALVVAITGFVFPFLSGYMVSRYVFDLDLMVALFIGGTLTATSIGITVRVLADLGRQASREGQVVLGAAVVDDVLGVVLLALLYEFSTEGGVSLISAGQILLFVGAFFLIAPVAAKLMAIVIKHFHAVSEIPGLLPTAVMSLVFFFAWLAHYFGAPALLGGFAAGLALSRRFFLPFVSGSRMDAKFEASLHAEMRPIVRLFTPIFFVMVGLSLDLRAVDWSSAFIWAFFAFLLVVSVAGKLVGAVLIKAPWPERMAIGMAMVPRGEVGLVFAELGRLSGVYSNDVYAGLVIVIASTTLLPPFAMKWFYARHGHRLEKQAPVD